MSAVAIQLPPSRLTLVEWTYNGGSASSRPRLESEIKFQFSSPRAAHHQSKGYTLGVTDKASLKVMSNHMTYTPAMRTSRDDKIGFADMATAAAAIAFLGGIGWAIVSASEYGLLTAAASMSVLAVIARRIKK